jgi:hypothetical protein
MPLQGPKNDRRPRGRRRAQHLLWVLGLRRAASPRIVPAAYYLVARQGFGSEQELADALGIAKDELGRWKRGKGLDPEGERLLRDVSVAVSELLTIYDAEVVPEWLHGRPQGETRSPLEWLREGNLAEVLNLINASATGAYS